MAYDGDAKAHKPIDHVPDGYEDQASCEEARQAYESRIIWYQTPTRRVSTMPCELTVRP